MNAERKRFGSHNGITLQLRVPVEGYRSGTFVIIDPVRSGLKGITAFDDLPKGTLLFAQTPDGNSIPVLKHELM